jgi:hypothetical protein
MKGVKEEMTLHHHPHSPLQKNLWCSSVESFLLKFFKACPCRHPFWHDSLRHVGLVSTIITIILHLMRYAIIGSGGGRWSWGVPSRRRHCFGISAVILTHLLFYIGVIEDDDDVVTERP